MKLRMGIRAIASTMLAVWGLNASSQDLLPIEEYARYPEISLMQLSPSGDRVAMRSTVGDKDGIIVLDIASGDFVGTAELMDVQPSNLTYVTDDHLVLTARKVSTSAFPVPSSTLYLFDAAKGRLREPLKFASNRGVFQAGFGRVVGRSEDHGSIYLMAWSNAASGLTHTFYRIDLQSRIPRQQNRGVFRAIDWFLREDGSVLLREDYDNRLDLHQLWHFDEAGEKALLFEQQIGRREVEFVGVTSDRSEVVFRKPVENRDVHKYFAMDIDTGEVRGPILDREGKDIDHVIADVNRTVIGVRYGGFLPTYQFFDSKLDFRVRNIQARLAGLSVSLVDWSDDLDKLLFYVTGPMTAGTYMLIQGDDSRPVSLGTTRPKFSREHIATVHIGEYKARDGLIIPMLVTARDDVYERGGAPLIVLPRGGPASRDNYGFHWQAQYFASRGYVVLQPQIRGTAGFGISYEEAGFGEWGGKMQTDLDDGVDHLVQAGIADPARVCIVGSSYGGYAALAAGAFSPDKYKCVVSSGGISDLRIMLKDEKRLYGSKHWVVQYWTEQFGSGTVDADWLRSISPYYHVEKFKAPVLLIHGKSDTLIPRDQSERMKRALEDAGKDVTYVARSGEDEFWGDSEDRLELLNLTADFIEKHNPAD